MVQYDKIERLVHTQTEPDEDDLVQKVVISKKHGMIYTRMRLLTAKSIRKRLKTGCS